jgi:hypothetical protein
MGAEIDRHLHELRYGPQQGQGQRTLERNAPEAIHFGRVPCPALPACSQPVARYSAHQHSRDVTVLHRTAGADEIIRVEATLNCSLFNLLAVANEVCIVCMYKVQALGHVMPHRAYISVLPARDRRWICTRRGGPFSSSRSRLV